ncbi:MAG: family 43 glycosylhydrolase [Prevotella sp.]|nr:family 43 glycosylhydrolase [Prevotella sp.]
MKRLFLSLALVLSQLSWSFAQTEVTVNEAKNLIKSTSKRWTSIHDPSVVYEPATKRYYIFGSHKAGAYTTDMQNWTQANPTWSLNNNSQAFVTPAVKKVKKGGAEVDFPQFNAMEWSNAYPDWRDENGKPWNIDGNMWAPDVIWNEKMQKWCMYLSINGPIWNSSIILLTSGNITGPYLYQGPVVISGFNGASNTSFKNTDLELVLGTQTSLPSRYNVGNGWGRRWPHTIDPAAFYDEDGKLWLVYGSWSGGIWMLQLNEENGLRDYDVTYPSTNGNSDGVTSDPYFGKKIGGGYYVSGEGPYIEHIGNYYYLFVSYGGFAPDGGYEMRIFRSQKPDGPYVDASGKSAIFTGYVLNYGSGADTRGEKIMGAYNHWGHMATGECAQGHNSIIAAEDGRTYLVYHTKFNNGTAGHQIRVHQVFQNKDGWLVAAPFEYNGEQYSDKDMAERQIISNEDLTGTYNVLIHKYKMDHAKMEEVVPVEVTLTEDGRVTGRYSGKWSIDEGTSYLTLTMSGITYKGVIYEQQMDYSTIKSVAFTATATNGVNVWGYKFHPKYAVAVQIASQDVPVTDGQQVAKNIDLYGMTLGVDNVDIEWISSNPDVLSQYGRYNPYGLTENTPVTLTARVSSGSYYWSETYNVTALSEENSKSKADWQSGLMALYAFDNNDLSNTLDPSQQAQLLRNSTATVPSLEDGDNLRNGGFVHTRYGANGKESYVAMPNPLFGQSLDKGATISFWVNPTTDNLWDALLGFKNGSARFFLTGNLYAGFNDGNTANEANQVYNNWIDINHPETIKNTNVSVARWNLVTIVISPKATASSGGITMYVNGSTKRNDRFNGSLNGKTISTKQGFDYKLILDLLSSCSEFYLGNGSFWGSADARFDEVMVYNRELSMLEVMGLNQMINRVFDPQSLTQGIEDISYDNRETTAGRYYDMSGRQLTNGRMTKGIYLHNGKKYIVK